MRKPINKIYTYSVLTLFVSIVLLVFAPIVTGLLDLALDLWFEFLSSIGQV